MELKDIAGAVQKYLQRANRNTAYIPYTTIMQECYAWYRNSTDWHSYFVFSGLRKVWCERAKLGMAKMGCEDWASLLLNENVKITASGELENNQIKNVLSDNNFAVEANRLVEIMFALGTGAFVETWNGEKVVIDYIHGDMIFPLTWDNGKITECAFAKIGGDLNNSEFTVILHTLEDVNGQKQYVIKTVELDAEGGVCRPTRPIQVAYGLKTIEEESKEFTSILYTDSDVPLFQIIKPNIVNNYDKTNPLGMGIIYNAIDILKSIDLEYDSLQNEFMLGKKRIFVKSGLKSIKQVDTNAKKKAIVNHIDPNDTMFYTLNTDSDDGKLPIQVYDPTLRTNEHNVALNTQLTLLSRAFGLGDGFYEFSSGKIARTATEIVSINSSLFRNLCKHELIISDAIKGLCKAVLNLYNRYGGTAYDINSEVTIDYDDSIIDDTEKRQQKAMAEFNAGLIDQVEYFVLSRNMTREQAKKFVAEMQSTDTLKEVSSIMNNYGF